MRSIDCGVGTTVQPAVLGLVARRIIGVDAWGGAEKEGFEGLMSADWRAEGNTRLVVVGRL